MPFQHLRSALQKHLRLLARCVPSGPLQLLSPQKHRRLGQKGPKSGGEQRDTRRTPEEGSPALRYLRHEVKVDDCCDEVSYSIALLNDTTRQATDFNGKIL